jgi:hypothetical protein
MTGDRLNRAVVCLPQVPHRDGNHRMAIGKEVQGDRLKERYTRIADS